MATYTLFACVLLLSAHVLATAHKTLMLVGGDLDDANSEIYKMIIDRANGPTICVIATAGDDPCCDGDSSWTFYHGLFTQYGASNLVYINITTQYRDNAYSNATVLDQIATCDGFWFGGGDQTRVMLSFYDNHVNGSVNTRTLSPAIRAVFDRFHTHGGVIAGTSAGTDCQAGRVMVTDGDAYFGLAWGTTPFNYSAAAPPVTNDSLVSYDPDGGLGNFPYGLLDTHFAERGRQGRMIRVLMDTVQLADGAPVGFGVDQNTVLVISLDDSDPEGVPKDVGVIYGQAGVTICNVQEASVNSSAPAFSVSNVRCSYATVGDSVHLKTGVIDLAPWKTPVAGRETPDQPFESKDIFNSPSNNGPVADRQFVIQASSLFNSTLESSVGTTYETSPFTFAVRMTKDMQSKAFQGLHVFNGTTLSYTSYFGLQVDIFPL